jgi:hypothetical protein
MQNLIIGEDCNYNPAFASARPYLWASPPAVAEVVRQNDLRGSAVPNFRTKLNPLLIAQSGLRDGRPLLPLRVPWARNVKNVGKSHPAAVQHTMDAKVTNSFREAVLPCIRLVQMMMSIDRMTGLLYILCWCLDIVQDIVLVWIESQTYTMTQQMFSNTAARKEIFPFLVKFWAAKIMISFGVSCVRRFQSGLEKRIKKVMRQKMTVLLLESFSSLDYVTQCNPAVIQQFQEGDRLFYGSVIRRAADVLSIMLYLARVLILCISLATQFRGRDDLVLVPIVLLILGIQACNRWRNPLPGLYLTVELWSSNITRNRKRGAGKTRHHRRRDALRFPYMPAEFRREAVLRNLGPWVTREYTKASNVLMNKPPKELGMKREVSSPYFTAYL